MWFIRAWVLINTRSHNLHAISVEPFSIDAGAQFEPCTFPPCLMFQLQPDMVEFEKPRLNLKKEKKMLERVLGVFLFFVWSLKAN